MDDSRETTMIRTQDDVSISTVRALALATLLSTLLSTTPVATAAGLDEPAWPEPPDWLLSGDFDGDGRFDLLSAAAGGTHLYLSSGDGAGGFAPPRSRTLPGRLTALAAGEVNRRDGLADFAVAVHGDAGAALLVFDSPRGAFDARAERYALPAAASEVAFGRFDDDPWGDAAAVTGEEVILVRGRDRRLSWQDPRGPAAPAEVVRENLAPWKTAVGGTGEGSAGDRGTGDGGGAILMVDSTGDGADFIPGDGDCDTAGGVCTLRAAIEEANALGGLDTVTFAPGLVAPIVLAGPLGVSDPIFIDGTSHPGFAGSPIVEIDASGSVTSALTLGAGSDGSTVRGLVIHGAPGAGIVISASSGNTLAGNYLGTDLTGTAALGNVDGVRITGASVGNVIGGLGEGDGNLISGNSSDGVELAVEAALTDTLVRGNLIGTDASGLLALGNGEHGLYVGSPSGTFGGTTADARNVIAFNGMHGVYLRDDDNLVQGNYIGVAADGTAAGNLGSGVYFGPPGSVASTVGGTAAGAGNVISANAGDGVQLDVGVDTLVQGNYIGTDPTGLVALGNGGHGVCDGCLGGFRNTIGGTVAGAGNVISANTLDGYSTGTFDSVVQGNIVGLGADGETLLGNGGFGIRGSDTLVGGSAPLAGNLVSANGDTGIQIGTDTAVLGNRVGVTESGAAAGNGGYGVYLVGVRTAVGGTASGEANLIANNTDDGVAVAPFNALNTISGNSIFANGGLGIDLDEDGVTVNDPGDPDTGSNDLQNFPVITAANAGNGSISGTLDSAAGVHVVEVFSSFGCDAAGNGEGTVYLGSGTVTADGSGTGVPFTLTVHPSFATGDAITATATNPGGSTSEFSTCLDATLTTIAIFADGFESGDVTAWSSSVRSAR